MKSHSISTQQGRAASQNMFRHTWGQRICFSFVRYSVLIIYFFSGSMFMHCSSPGPKETDKYPVPGDSIGPAGGTVFGPGGTSIVVPAGALDSSVFLSIACKNSSSLPLIQQVSAVRHVVECLPNGAVFASPVTIHIPLSSDSTSPGASCNLYLWYPSDSIWELMETVAVVSSDGRFAEAQVSHFSTLGAGSPRNVSQRGRFFQEHDNHAFVYANFESFRDFVNSQIWKVGEYKVIAGCCMRAKMLHFDVHYSALGFVDSFQESQGDANEYCFMERFNYREGGPGYTFFVRIAVQVFWEACEPMVEIDADKTHFILPEDKNETSSILAKVSCGSIPMDEVPFTFTVASGSGRIDPPGAQTNPGGTAQAVYTPESTGDVHVEAGLKLCGNTPCGEKQVRKQIKIVVDSCTGRRLQVDALFVHKDENAPWTFRNNVIMYVDYFVEEDGSVTAGVGIGSHAVSVSSTEEDCRTHNVSAPDFHPTMTGSINGSDLTFELNPGMISCNFTYTCDFGDGDGFSRVVPAYGYLISTVLARECKGTLNMIGRENSQKIITDSENFGEDMPLSYSITITVACDR